MPKLNRAGPTYAVAFDRNRSDEQKVNPALLIQVYVDS